MGVWHTYSTRQTLSELETDKSRGLSGAEAERRLARWGPNRLEEGRRQGLLLRFLGQMKDPMILVLLAAAALSLWASGGEDWLDAAIILVIVVVNACISISQEDSAEKALEALRKMSAPLAKVVRDGALQRLERHYTNHDPKIYTIPVGSLPELIGQDKPRKPFSMITASRLAQEKHIDWLVRAVIEVHKTLPDITFDIYGSGSMDAKLREIIVEAQAGDYIRLMGHADLTDIYSQYEVYLTASTSEGFGLTLMEAVGSGLPMIGFDVPYGNQTFIEDGGNGYLLPVAENHVVDVITKSYKDAIVRLYEEGNIEAMRQKSYDLAKGFLTSQVKAAWKQLLEEVRS